QPERVSSAGASIPQPERVSSEPARKNTVRPEVSKGGAEVSKPLELTPQILAHNRRAIAKAITLLESTRPDHRRQADILLNTLLPHTGRSLRLGISGVPGVGKSTFIEALGLHLIAQGH